MSQILVQKLGALAHMSSLLKSPNRSLQKTAMSLVGNMSRSSNLQTSMGKKKHETLLYAEVAKAHTFFTQEEVQILKKRLW